MEMRVLKIGGSVLRAGQDFGRAADMIEGEGRGGRLPICVVSAMKGVTDRLVQAAERAAADDGFDPRGFVEKLLGEHLGTAPEGVPAHAELREEFEDLEQALNRIKTSRELSDSAYAYAVSRGENFSSTLLSLHLEGRGVPSRRFHGEDLIVTDGEAKDAAVLLEETKRRVESSLRPLAEARRVPIVAGFAGRSREGVVTILGRGGSDVSAACIAYSLGVRDVVKYTDEDGIMTIDPKFLGEVRERHPGVYESFRYILPQPRVIPYLSYLEASELLREERAKVVHYGVLDPLMRGGIRLHIRNISRPDSGGTVIGPDGNGEEAGNKAPKAISLQRDLYCLRFLPFQSCPPTRVYARVFAALADGGVDVRHMSTSGYQISILLERRDLDRALENLRGLDIAMDVIEVEGRKGTFSLIGSGMKGMHGIFSRIAGTLLRNGVNIEQVTQPDSENIIRFSVDDEDIPSAVCALYSDFFR